MLVQLTSLSARRILCKGFISNEGISSIKTNNFYSISLIIVSGCGINNQLSVTRLGHDLDLQDLDVL